MEIKIKKAIEISRDIGYALDQMEIEKLDQYMIPALLFSTAIEHHRSILVLIEKRLYGSASSLLGCLFESYVKGLWFSKCAKDSDFQKLRKDEFKKTFNTLIKDIEKIDGKGLSKVKDAYWNIMNSLTHSGLHQLGRRATEFEITSNYDQAFISDMIRLATNYGFLSCSQVAIISKNEQTLKRVVSIANKFGLPK